MRTRVGLNFSTVLFTLVLLVFSVWSPVAVGVTGFEPAAFRSQSGCATKLRYTPRPVAVDCKTQSDHARYYGQIAQCLQLDLIRAPPVSLLMLYMRA